ncbi:MAG TPA: hypothetical protein P5248_06970, partial [Bacteroidales bacterium]|nr:hypothetical protein [Bacteroidales bacterium]
MSFDEYIYSRFIRYFGSRRPDQATLERTAHLEVMKPRLTVLARALTGESIELFPAEREGGRRGHGFFLPGQCALLPSLTDNLSYYLFRVVYLSCQHRLGLNWPQGEEGDLGASRLRARESSDMVLDMLRVEFPSAMELHGQLLQQLQALEEPDLSWLYGKWMSDPVGKPDSSLTADGGAKGRPAQPKPQTTLQARPVESVQTLQVDKKMQEDYVLTHNFEKVETAEEYDGVWRDFDGEDDLEDHSAALDELNMRFTVRSDEMTHSVYQAEFTGDTTIAEAADSEGEGHFIAYDEWDVRKQAYRPAFCRVFPHYPKASDPGFPARVIGENASTLESLRKTLANVSNRRRQVRYQTQGEDFDLDLVTDMYVDIHNRHTPSEKIYLSPRKRDKDLSILLLLDNSLST